MAYRTSFRNSKWNAFFCFEKPFWSLTIQFGKIYSVIWLFTKKCKTCLQSSEFLILSVNFRVQRCRYKSSRSQVFYRIICLNSYKTPVTGCIKPTSGLGQHLQKSASIIGCFVNPSEKQPKKSYTNLTSNRGCCF